MAKEPPHLQRGKLAEDRASRHLQQKGLTLQQRNYRCTLGEIDLVMVDATGMLVFVEVRYRGSTAFGSAAETVNWKKQKKLVAAAEHYLLNHRSHADLPCRFDIISVSGDPEQGPLQWLQNAF